MWGEVQPAALQGVSQSRYLGGKIKKSPEEKEIASQLQKKKRKKEERKKKESAEEQTFKGTNLPPLILCPISQCSASEQSTGFQRTLKMCSFPLTQAE